VGRCSLWPSACAPWLAGAVLTYAGLKSDLEELPARKRPQRECARRATRPAAGGSATWACRGHRGPGNVPAAKRFLDDLARRVRTYPSEMVEEVRAGAEVERRFAETYFLQLMDPADVRRLTDTVQSRRDWEVRHAMGLELLDESEDPRPRIPSPSCAPIRGAIRQGRFSAG